MDDTGRALLAELQSVRDTYMAAEQTLYARAQTALTLGVPIEEVCDVLDMSRATLYRRIAGVNARLMSQLERYDVSQD